MDAKSLFDSEAYFSKLCAKNRLAKALGFKFCTCTGIESLQGPLDSFRTTNVFFCLDDANDGVLFRGKSGGWFMKRTFTVFMMRRHKLQDETARIAALTTCRILFRQIMSRLLVDQEDLSNEMVYLHTENVMSREFGQYFLSGCTGLYFMIDVSEPVDLTYDSEEWEN